MSVIIRCGYFNEFACVAFELIQLLSFAVTILTGWNKKSYESKEYIFKY